jgi:hypothetical protein
VTDTPDPVMDADTPFGRVVKEPRPARRRCPRPPSENHRIGTVWKCRCGTRLKLTVDDYGVRYWRRTFWSWLLSRRHRGVSEGNRRGYTVDDSPEAKARIQERFHQEAP